MFRAMLVVGGLLWALSASASDLWAQSTLQGIIKRGELRVGMEAGYMPFEMRDKSGRIIGFDVDIARLMARAMGVALKLVNTAWDGIIPSLLTDKFDVIIAGMTITPERNLQVNFTQPYMLIGQSIVLNKRHEKTVSSYRDLNDPKFVISTKLGTTGDIAARRYLSRAQVRTYESESEAVTEVRNGRADAFVYDLPYNAVYVAQHRDHLLHLDEPFTKEALAWAIRKGDPDFLNWLDHFLAQIRRDGTYDALYEKWFERTEWLENVN